MKLNNINYLNLPQQVEKNKEDIQALQKTILPIDIIHLDIPLQGVHTLSSIGQTPKLLMTLIGTDGYLSQIENIEYDIFGEPVLIALKLPFKYTVDGPQGPQGEEGPQGPQGEEGPQGAFPSWAYQGETNDAPIGVDLTGYSELLVQVNQGITPNYSTYSYTYIISQLPTVGAGQTRRFWINTNTDNQVYWMINNDKDLITISGTYCTFKFYAR